MHTRKRMHPELRRKQIVDTAVRLFFTMGYEGASLRDLADQVGINKATVYHYFESKEEILFHIVDRVGEELVEGVREAQRSSPDPLTELEAMIRFQIGYMEDNFAQIKVLVEEKKSLRADLEAKSLAAEAAVLRMYKETLARAMESGQVRRHNLSAMAFGILGQVNWLYQWYRPDGELTIAQLSDEVVSMIFDGLVDPAKRGSAS
jgi:AcrR family transcriptional regulator